MSITPEFIRTEIEQQSYEISIHADNERLADGLTVSQLEEALSECTVIERYPDDPRGESCLVVGFTHEGPSYPYCVWQKSCKAFNSHHRVHSHDAEMERSVYQESIRGGSAMAKKYSPCFYCGGEVEEQLLPREFRWKGKVYVLENVPIGVCQQCGEKYLQPEVSKTIDRILQAEKDPIRTIEVPVYQYESDMA